MNDIKKKQELLVENTDRIFVILKNVMEQFVLELEINVTATL